uniref:Ig-like domain-containing protein n=1 Tax=Eutreptiella gymnastica TaxID=73025 RepID=A0A7S1J5N9_9EUGL
MSPTPTKSVTSSPTFITETVSTATCTRSTPTDTATPTGNGTTSVSPSLTSTLSTTETPSPSSRHSHTCSPSCTRTATLTATTATDTHTASQLPPSTETATQAISQSRSDSRWSQTPTGSTQVHSVSGTLSPSSTWSSQWSVSRTPTVTQSATRSISASWSLSSTSTAVASPPSHSPTLSGTGPTGSPSESPKSASLTETSSRTPSEITITTISPATFTHSVSLSPSWSQTHTETFTPSRPTPSPTVSHTKEFSDTATSFFTDSFSVSFTTTQTERPTVACTETCSPPTPTFTPPSQTPSHTSTQTHTSTVRSPSLTSPSASVQTASGQATLSPTDSHSRQLTDTESHDRPKTFTVTGSGSPDDTPSATCVLTPSISQTPTDSPTKRGTSSHTPSFMPTRTLSRSATCSITYPPTKTRSPPTPTPTFEATVTYTLTVPSPSLSITCSATHIATQTYTLTPRSVSLSWTTSLTPPTRTFSSSVSLRTPTPTFSSLSSTMIPTVSAMPPPTQSLCLTPTPTVNPTRTATLSPGSRSRSASSLSFTHWGTRTPRPTETATPNPTTTSSKTGTQSGSHHEITPTLWSDTPEFNATNTPTAPGPTLNDTTTLSTSPLLTLTPSLSPPSLTSTLTYTPTLEEQMTISQTNRLSQSLDMLDTKTPSVTLQETLTISDEFLTAYSLNGTVTLGQPFTITFGVSGLVGPVTSADFAIVVPVTRRRAGFYPEYLGNRPVTEFIDVTTLNPRASKMKTQATGLSYNPLTDRWRDANKDSEYQPDVETCYSNAGFTQKTELGAAVLENGFLVENLTLPAQPIAGVYQVCYSARGVFSVVMQPVVVHGPTRMALYRDDPTDPGTKVEWKFGTAPYVNDTFDIRFFGYGLSRYDLYTITNTTNDCPGSIELFGPNVVYQITPNQWTNETWFQMKDIRYTKSGNFRVCIRYAGIKPVPYWMSLGTFSVTTNVPVRPSPSPSPATSEAPTTFLAGAAEFLDKNAGIVVPIGIGAVVAICLACCFLTYYCIRMRRKRREQTEVTWLNSDPVFGHYPLTKHVGDDDLLTLEVGEPDRSAPGMALPPGVNLDDMDVMDDFFEENEPEVQEPPSTPVGAILQCAAPSKEDQVLWERALEKMIQFHQTESEWKAGKANTQGWKEADATHEVLQARRREDRRVRTSRWYQMAEKRTKQEQDFKEAEERSVGGRVHPAPLSQPRSPVAASVQSLESFNPLSPGKQSWLVRPQWLPPDMRSKLEGVARAQANPKTVRRTDFLALIDEVTRSARTAETVLTSHQQDTDRRPSDVPRTAALSASLVRRREAPPGRTGVSNAAHASALAASAARAFREEWQRSLRGGTQKSVSMAPTVQRVRTSEDSASEGSARSSDPDSDNDSEDHQDRGARAPAPSTLARPSTLPASFLPPRASSRVSQAITVENSPRARRPSGAGSTAGTPFPQSPPRADGMGSGDSASTSSSDSEIEIRVVQRPRYSRPASRASHAQRSPGQGSPGQPPKL